MSLYSKLDDPSAFFVSQCILLHMCDLALFAMTTIRKTNKNKLMYNSFYLLYVENQKTTRNKKEKKKHRIY